MSDNGMAAVFVVLDEHVGWEADAGRGADAACEDGCRAMKYRSKPTEVEAMQWWADGAPGELDSYAHEVIHWVNANGGEARYVPLGEDTSNGWSGYPRLAVRTINGWAYAAPGHYVVMGSAWFEYYTSDGNHRVRDFYPCNPETFESRWEYA